MLFCTCVVSCCTCVALVLCRVASCCTRIVLCCLVLCRVMLVLCRVLLVQFSRQDHQNQSPFTQKLPSKEALQNSCSKELRKSRRKKTALVSNFQLKKIGLGLQHSQNMAVPLFKYSASCNLMLQICILLQITKISDISVILTRKQHFQYREEETFFHMGYW